MSATANRIIKNTAFLYARLGVTMFIALWTTRLVLNALGVSDYGIYNIVGGAIGMMGFLNASMASATQRFMNYVEGQGDIEKKKEIFNTSLFIHVIISLLVCIVLVVAGLIFFNGVLNIPEDRLHAAYVVYGCMVVSTMLTVVNSPYEAVLTSHENMRYYAVIGVFESILKLLVAFTCVYSLYDKLIVYGVLMACIPVVTLTIMKIYCYRHYSECIISPFRYINRESMREISGFAGWNFFVSMSSLVGNHGNSLVMNHFYGTILNTALGIANQISGQLYIFSNYMLKAMAPVITKSEGGGHRAQVLRFANTGCKFSFALLAIFAIPAIIEMPFIQKKWLRIVPEWAVLFAQLQLVRTLIEQLTISYCTAINAEGHIKPYVTTKSIINFVPVTCLYVLFCLGYSPVYIYVLNISIFGIFLSAVNIYFAHRNCGLKYADFTKKLLIPVSISFGVAFALASIPSISLEEGWGRLFLTIAIGFFSYIMLFWFISMDYIEREIVKAGLIRFRMRIRN